MTQRKANFFRDQVLRGDYKEVLIHVIAALINLIRTGLSPHIILHEIHLTLTSPKCGPVMIMELIFLLANTRSDMGCQSSLLVGDPFFYTQAPAIILCPKAPKGDELILSSEMTKEYAEVGLRLIVGDVPEKHSNKGTKTKGTLTMSTEASLGSPRSPRARASTSRLGEAPASSCGST
ncbi:hypothetical protein FPCIR_12213 [Fusarium pseudocircinatum]|uniref:Uncharacterized protein n=1 Tax=Fusarium pseudocircinatum TaxID=56676 RepID=A0A8H5NVC0_9HYPO|nr:hypothetical protein FPCIR_12213 [Fusarium pseudocircinatum]